MDYMDRLVLFNRKLQGPPEDSGINQRALRELFAETGERSGEWTYTINVSVMEIYNEMLR